MNNPLISIIIPIYNTEKYLNKCLCSVISQSFKNIEIILVDDGSTDNSPKICDEYAKKDNRIKVIHKPNGGLSDARNHGVFNAIGKYILFVDSDDFIAENSLYNIKITLEEVGDVDVIFLEAMKYFERNNSFVSLGDGYKKEKIINKDKKNVLHHLALLPKYPGSACTKLINRELIIHNNLYFKKGITNEDLEWTIRLLLVANKFNYCDIPYYYYRQERVGSITNQFSEEKFKCLFDVIKQFSKFKKEDKGFDFRIYIYSFMAYEYNILLAHYANLNTNIRKNYKQEIKSYSWLMNYRNDRKNKLVKNVYKILGLEITSKLLNWYLRIR